MTDTLVLEQDLRSVRTARRFVARRLAGHADRLVDDVTLMVSELVTNAIRHTKGDCGLTLNLDDEFVRVEVRDSGPDSPVLRSPAPNEPSGRGLRIVAGLADDWGFDAVPGVGNVVWFVVRLDRNRFPGAQATRPTATT